MNIEFVYIILRNDEEDGFVQTVENNSFHYLKTLTNHTTLSSTLKLFDTWNMFWNRGDTEETEKEKKLPMYDDLSIKNDLLKVDIIVPFRDRHKHLKKFQKHFANVSNLYNLNIYIIEQANPAPHTMPETLKSTTCKFVSSKSNKLYLLGYKLFLQKHQKLC